ncbi:MAG: ATP-dependent helicase, partial [Candidatus Hydrogenedentes bacterium]|nr:ATP-dependent helicase [Candidatus Hydrogenedentota bacterium]
MRLNSSQTQAAAHAGGPALVLAGAGSGKTRVIIERMAWLIGEQGLDPRHLLALTFTNKAANEMRTRLAARLGADRVGVWVGTFHSFALFLLRREFDRMNRSRSFTVYDDADQLSLMKLTIAEAGKAAQAKSPREALVWISRRKQDLGVVTPELRQSDPVLCELWERYQAALEHNNAVDFDDLLVFAARLLVDHHEVRAKY